MKAYTPAALISAYLLISVFLIVKIEQKMPKEPFKRSLQQKVVFRTGNNALVIR